MGDGQTPQEPPKPKESVLAWFGAKWPVIRGVSVFLLLMGGFYGLIQTPAVDSGYFQPYLAWIAGTTSWLLRAIGEDIAVDGTTIRSLTAPGFAVQIVRGCDALAPAAAFVAAVVASPARWRRKLVGILVGTSALLTINLVRIVGLFVVGVHVSRRVFDLLHIQVFQVVFIVLAVAFWAIWAEWATSKPKSSPQGEGDEA